MKNSKSISKITLSIFLISQIAFAQPTNKQKIDGVVGVVGEYVVLDSDVDLEFIQLKAQGVDTKNITRCEMFGKLLEDRLYAHQAIQDSIVVTNEEVNDILRQQLDAIMEEEGSLEQIIKFYNKKNEEDLRSHFFDVIKMNKLTSEMQKKIVQDIEITPEEVRNFFREIPEDEIPTLGEEVEVAQIVIKPTVSEEAKLATIQKLKNIKQEVINGSSFFSKAVLFSQDPGSSSNGGFYKMNRKTPFVKEFKDVAFTLDEGEISEPFETDFGYHIIMVEKIKGQDVELRHILIKPEITTEALQEAKKRIETIRTKVLNNEITFAEAAKAESDEKETKNSGGILYNPRTMETKFELTKMDPSLYNKIVDLKEGEISQPYFEEDRGNQFYKIITINSKTPEHKAEFAKDYMRIKDMALTDKQFKAVNKWTAEKIDETYIKIDKQYQECEFSNNWFQNR